MGLGVDFIKPLNPNKDRVFAVDGSDVVPPKWKAQSTEGWELVVLDRDLIAQAYRLLQTMNELRSLVLQTACLTPMGWYTLCSDLGIDEARNVFLPRQAGSSVWLPGHPIAFLPWDHG